MSNVPIEKQFARLRFSSSDQMNQATMMGSSEEIVSKLGSSVVSPQTNQTQPQAPTIPRSLNAPGFQEPSFSTVLRGECVGEHSAEDLSVSTYENVMPYFYNNEPVYSNIQTRSSLSPYLPPPPPPPPPVVCVAQADLPFPSPPHPSDLIGYYAGNDHLPAFSPLSPSSSPDELTSPPSPVSSSYSELRRAGCGSTTGSTSNYAPLSQASNYESIYEPIQPRTLLHHSPAGSMSSLTRPSHYSSAYPAYPGASGSAAAKSSTTTNHKRPVQEEDVDALTNLLVQSMDNAADPEFFGMCADCGLKVVGEGSGCTAMDRVFHIACFTCRICNCRLQGKPFYAVEGEPHCQECYLNSLEKCCVCTEPILDRILRATGKPYHPQCFTCVVCNICLDGIPFTVDAANRIHCIDDFHKKFAPRCSVCHEPIMPEPGQEETVRVVALDRSFHVQCYKCEDCELVLSSEAEGRGCYPLDGRILCKSCNAIRVNALCSNTATEL